MTKTLNSRKLGKTNNNTDEFEKYLKRQCANTTCNGNPVAAFSWYKKAFGL